MEPTNVFMTKSFWLPVIGYAVTWIATELQTVIVFSAETQTGVIGAVTLVIIAIVRRVTNRPTTFFGGD